MNPLRQFPEPVTQLISLEELYLNDTTLDYLPANVGRLVKLRILELRDNRLSTLPRAIARFTRLLRLDIGQNDFTYLPEVVGELTELHELWLDLNGMVEVPMFIRHLKKLNHLDISENVFEDVPEGIGECSQLTELTLTSNDIRGLPAAIGKIKNLVTMKLDLNDIHMLPNSIGELACLEELYLSANKLETLPTSIGLLRNLICLELDSNRISYLPPELGSCISLRILTIQNNLLRYIPAEIGNLTNLTVLSLTNNKLRSLPMSVLKLRRLKALWLVYNQSKPLTPLVKEYDPKSHSMVLTCYLLPQTDYLQDSFTYVPGDETPGRAQKQRSLDRPKIRFSISTTQERQSVLMRAPTPYPRKLRELAKFARAITSQTNNSQLEQQGEVQVLNANGTNPLVDQVRTAVKKQTPSVANSSVTNDLPRGSEIPAQRRHHPPPYHIAKTFSKQASLFQNDSSFHKEERRTDLDSEALSTLKDELLQSLPPNDCQMSQSEQSGSVELIYPPANETSSDRVCSVAMSDVDSAFVDNVDSNYRTLEVSRSVNHTPGPCQYVSDGTYSAYPGIVITESPSNDLPSENNDLQYDFSNYPISKVSSWLISKTKSPVNTESGCEFINMYPCENRENDSNQVQGPSSSMAVINKKQEECPLSPDVVRPAKPWLFGVHKNPKVVEVVINKTGPDLGFEISASYAGVFIKNVSPHLMDKLKEGDKILQVEGPEVNDASNILQILNALKGMVGPFSMMISRQT
ncbi:erbin-like isoform X2 [Macrosteles quadrilineatus]|nr:erbin-like isoform X2 [Macrosteles quadrilineatus]